MPTAPPGTVFSSCIVVEGSGGSRAMDIRLPADDEMGCPVHSGRVSTGVLLK